MIELKRSAPRAEPDWMKSVRQKSFGLEWDNYLQGLDELNEIVRSISDRPRLDVDPCPGAHTAMGKQSEPAI